MAVVVAVAEEEVEVVEEVEQPYFADEETDWRCLMPNHLRVGSKSIPTETRVLMHHHRYYYYCQQLETA